MTANDWRASNRTSTRTSTIVGYLVGSRQCRAGGKLVWSDKGGFRDREKSLEVTDDTIWRIYSMTKPITSIAVMMLYEEGRFDLNDDVRSVDRRVQGAPGLGRRHGREAPEQSPRLSQYACTTSSAT